MPAWIPGSYKIRDYARHIVSISARVDDFELELTKIDKSSWQCAATDGPLTLTLEIFAHEQTVRGAHLDQSHAYFNGPCVFPEVVGQSDLPCELDIIPATDGTGRDWRVATSMRRKNADLYGYGAYESDNYDELIDHPVEIGNLQIGEFEVEGIPHVIAMRSHVNADMGRVCHDLSTLCSQQLNFLGAPTDLDRYVFLLNVMGQGYGGLEHRWSTSLVCSRRDLPKRGASDVDENYRKFLGLCSHEYFHLWNIKRIKPEKFTPFDLSAETYTGQMWVFEGITSYYDDLFLVRSGLITTESYLELVAHTITRLMRTPGRFRQSVEESSFDAWIKLYQPNANSSNATVSYYAKGSMIALALDLTLRQRSGGQCSLDSVMRECWSRFGESGIGMPERGFESIAETVLGAELSDFFDHYVRGTGDLPLSQLLGEFGVTMHLRPAESAKDKGGSPAKSAARANAWIGATINVQAGKSVFSTVRAGSPAELAGIAPGDEPVALDGYKLTARNVGDLLRDCHAGQKVSVQVFRDDQLLRFPVTLVESPEDTCYLTLDSDATAAVEEKRQGWLGISD